MADFAAEASQSWASTLKDLDPPSFLKKFWSKSTRSDGRLFSMCRRTRMTRGILKLRTAGSSLIQLGNTQIVCGISLLVGQPSIPDNGDLVVTRADSPDFSLPLQSILTEMLDLSCLALGEAQAWRLQVTLQVLEDDGNLNDACLLAAVAALTDTRLPPTQRNPQTERIEIMESSQENGSSLKFNYIPVPLTLGIYFGKDQKTTFLLADPTVEEEALLQGQLTIVVKLDDKNTEEQHNIVHVQHSCAPPGLKREDLAVAAHMAYGRD
eukprot:CAMPEP_0178921394 /NCGR_PEP_ID=MMETSP0786-20121207/15539_1 /TAXON_ID=186022 /ORGANISM="Thalassionema frauenfeldii, Strain CCMP 1798" /LENGTH=266 /DNA_ID=CAMNT_0020595573 /DNA_START=19 /DNA_END=816 /DNA_ORIENTATION=-